MARKLRKFIPPTLNEVEQYVKDNSLTVEPAFFLKYFTDGEWIDSKGNPVKNWKQKLLTWHRANLRKGEVHKCYCGKIGVYIAGYDDVGYPSWRCIDHKPQPKPAFPKEMTANVLKQVPQADNRSVSDKVNDNLNKLKG